MLERKCKHNSCATSARFRIETTDEDDDAIYILKEWGYSCREHLISVCNRLSFRDQSPDAIIDLTNGDCYDSPNSARNLSSPQLRVDINRLEEVTNSLGDNFSILF